MSVSFSTVKTQPAVTSFVHIPIGSFFRDPLVADVLYQKVGVATALAYDEATGIVVPRCIESGNDPVRPVHVTIAITLL